MCLVNHHQRQRQARRQRGQQVRVVEPLRADKQHFDGAGRHSRQHLLGLGAALPRPQHRSRELQGRGEEAGGRTGARACA